MRRHGFTLVELLIVVAIIGILAAIALPNFRNATIRAKVAHSLSEMKTYKEIQQLYLLDYGDIPGHFDGEREHCPYINLDYLNGPLTDPFAIDDPDVKEKSHQGMYHSTHLRDPQSIKTLNHLLFQEWERRGKGYVILGEGPGLSTWDYYDISNGLFSNGMMLSASIKGKGPAQSNMPGRKCF